MDNTIELKVHRVNESFVFHSTTIRQSFLSFNVLEYASYKNVKNNDDTVHVHCAIRP